MKSIVIKGIVLSNQDYKDNDLLVKVLCSNNLIYTFLARGAKKSTSKLKSAVQMLTLIEFEGSYPKNDGLGYLNSIQQIKNFPHIVNDLNAYNYSSSLTNLMSAVCNEDSKLNWYNLFIDALEKINEGKDPQIITNVLEIKALADLGYDINLAEDPINHSRKGKFDFSDKYNGILAENNWWRDERRLHINPKAMYYIMIFKEIDLKLIQEIKIDQAIKREIQRLIDYLYDSYIGFYSVSKYVIQKMDLLEKQAQYLKQVRKMNLENKND